jgi:hypothetical protein
MITVSDFTDRHLMADNSLIGTAINAKADPLIRFARRVCHRNLWVDAGQPLILRLKHPLQFLNIVLIMVFAYSDGIDCGGFCS